MRTLFVMLAVCVTTTLFAQSKNEVFLPETKVTWLGIDFTEAIFIGDREALGDEDRTKKFIESLNTLMIAEKDKYNIARAIDKPKVENRVDITTEHNRKLDVSLMYSDREKDYFHQTKDGIAKIVFDYEYADLHGIGLMFIVESFSKLNVEGLIWVTFIDMDTREVIFTERMASAPGGFGLRNYWAGSIHRIIERMTKKEFSMWRKKYFRS